MQTIFPGLYMITRAVTNCYLIESAVDELTVIDTGLSGTTKTILTAAASLNYRPEQIKHILITHADVDHVGSLHGLAKATGATTYAGEESKPYIEAAESPPHIPALAKLLFAPMMRLMHKKATVDTTFADNETLDIADGILALHTPGHTPDNYCFYWRKHKVLFAADLFFTLRGHVTLTPSRFSWSADAARKSAIKALDLAPEYLCSGHGPVINLVKNPQALTSLRRQLKGNVAFAAI